MLQPEDRHLSGTACHGRTNVATFRSGGTGEFSPYGFAQNFLQVLPSKNFTLVSMDS
jgi:hypothetical protein